MEGEPSPGLPVLAFDLGGTRLKAGLVCGSHIDALQIVNVTDEGKSEHILQLLCDVGRTLLARQRVQAIGISVRGIIEEQQGMILDVNAALASLIGYPLAQTVGEYFNLPVFMENDARMYALGEWLYGAGQGCTNLVCFTLGTGIGNGVILHQRVLRGSRHVAGILGGHLTVQADGPLCSCGNRGCLESFIGTPGLMQMVSEQLPSFPASRLHTTAVTPKHLFAAAAEGDELAGKVIERFSQLLGAGIVNTIHAYDPDRIVLGGGFIHAAQTFLPAVQRYVDTHAWSIPRGRVKLVPTRLGDGAALVGIAAAASRQGLFL